LNKKLNNCSNNILIISIKDFSKLAYIWKNTHPNSIYINKMLNKITDNNKFCEQRAVKYMLYLK